MVNAVIPRNQLGFVKLDVGFCKYRGARCLDLQAVNGDLVALNAGHGVLNIRFAVIVNRYLSGTVNAEIGIQRQKAATADIERSVCGNKGSAVIFGVDQCALTVHVNVNSAGKGGKNNGTHILCGVIDNSLSLIDVIKKGNVYLGNVGIDFHVGISSVGLFANGHTAANGQIGLIPHSDTADVDGIVTDGRIVGEGGGCCHGKQSSGDQPQQQGQHQDE